MRSKVTKKVDFCLAFSDTSLSSASVGEHPRVPELAGILQSDRGGVGSVSVDEATFGRATRKV